MLPHPSFCSTVLDQGEANNWPAWAGHVALYRTVHQGMAKRPHRRESHSTAISKAFLGVEMEGSIGLHST